MCAQIILIWYVPMQDFLYICYTPQGDSFTQVEASGYKI